ncbi:MAG: 50S ribosomal protein L29 [Chloroflexi bacterium GWB2_49_20]|nr:MAG: 50S ribosomal protein L29 [Chloroflexi bacterium GWB2_49_20]OGN76648.1 MAG: 50S ribosomal protein L29 [Chloroflexi bacterium GWC2_49_37]OGN83608.1 MAG: 50S ribosomal protein L29 [Chloroflexi bacterium GWD2_49_16]HBG74273.1 50S ribosomal protein L29 [Anaerolineae bacterium]HCC79478.1 50S ribosomal protein L29 [Anaerolineae bacterium]
MKTSEMRALSAEELKTKMTDAREELMKLRFQVVSGQLTDTSRLPVVRKEIARIQTIINERVGTTVQEGEK